MWKRWLSLPLFWIQLAWEVFPTLLGLSSPYVRRYGMLLSSLGMFILTLLLYLASNTNPTTKLEALANRFSPPTPPPQVKVSLEPWASLNQVQPLHRDVLTNLARSLTNAGEATAAQTFVETATNLDPNFNFSAQQ